MIDAIEQAWTHLEEVTRLMCDAAKRVDGVAARMKGAATDGSLASVARALEGLDADHAQFLLRMDDVRSAAETLEGAVSSDALLKELEQLLRESRPDVPIFRTYGGLIVYPTVVAGHGSGWATKVTVDEEPVKNLRPSAVAASVESVLKTSDRSDKFLKSLHQAFRALNDGREVGSAPLATLYEVLAVSPLGRSQYSMKDFGVDLQHLRASGKTFVTSSIGFRLDLAHAAKSAIPIFERSGDRINLGYIAFASSGDARG